MCSRNGFSERTHCQARIERQVARFDHYRAITESYAKVISMEENKLSNQHPQALLELVNKASHGDTKAFSELISDPAVETQLRRTAAYVLRRYGSRGVYRDTEDLVQDVYAKILSNLKTMDSMNRIKSEAEFNAWISGVARNIYIDSLRKRFSEEKHVPTEEALQTDKSYGESQYSETLVKELLDKLEPRERRILQMLIEGYKLRQIADKLGISVATAARLSRKVQNTVIGELDESRKRMNESQREIEQEKELTRLVINELIA